MTQTLQQLEERIEALEDQLEADQLTPGVFSLNAKGQVEEKLTGTLEAKGIHFGGSGAESLNTIEWGTGNKSCQIIGVAGGAISRIELLTTKEAAKALVEIVASENLPHKSRVLLKAGPTNYIQIDAALNVEIGAETSKIGLYQTAPVAQAAAIPSPAAELAALKTAVDEIRVALKNIGITK